MIAATSSRPGPGCLPRPACHAGRGGARPRPGASATVAACRRCGAPGAGPRRLASGLDGFLGDGRPAPAPALAAAAARAFSAGNGYLTGLIVDRSA